MFVFHTGVFGLVSCVCIKYMLLKWNTSVKIQVEELQRRKLMKEAAEKELQEFIQLLKSAKAMPRDGKPPKSSWMADDKIRHKIESLESYAIDACKNDDQKRTAELVNYSDLKFVLVLCVICANTVFRPTYIVKLMQEFCF